MKLFRVLTVVGLLACSPAAFAAMEAELWAGSYVPDPEVLDSDISYGARWLMSGAPHLSYGIELGYINTSGDSVSGATTTRVEWDSLFFDFVGDYALGSNPKVQPVLTLGLGAAFSDAQASFTGPLVSVDVDAFDSTSLTLQAGFGVKIGIGQSAFLRPAARLRWFENREDDDLDTEYLIGIGRRW